MQVYGKNVALEYLDSEKVVKRVYLSDSFNDNEIKDLINRRHINVKHLSKHDMDRKCSGLHQGIILDVEDYQYQELDTILDKESALVVMLDHIEDPHNFGAIIRTCEAAGVDLIIIPEDRSVSINSTVIKTSVGTLFNMKIAKVNNLVNAIKYLKKQGFWIVGTDMKGTDYDKIDYKGNTCIICGNEGSGMSRLVRENCDFIATINMLGNVNSLNASVATGIILFEAIKNRRY